MTVFIKFHSIFLRDKFCEDLAGGSFEVGAVGGKELLVTINVMRNIGGVF